MCGLTGFLDPSGFADANRAREIVATMADSISHRGPDDRGEWVSAPLGVAFGFRRLAIVDPTPSGHQPMLSHSGRFQIVFNGEVYNFSALREELAVENPTLSALISGSSDTAVMLAAFEHWGIEAAVRRFVGMFAIALLDSQERQLYLIRDRIGEKPLYYGWSNGTLLFGSELKSLRKHPAFDSELNVEAIDLLLRRTFIPTPHTVYRRFRKLIPGTVLRVSIDHADEHNEPEPYWSLHDVALLGIRNRFQGSEAEALQELRILLGSAVGQEMLADVPVGAFLSGGVDSSLIVALMQAQHGGAVRTFSLGFDHPRLNEAPHAKAIAKHLGTDHTELYVTEREAMEIVPSLPTMYDEPFADSSQIPTAIVSRLARQFVTVSLTGDGGDELFGGYNAYAMTMKLWPYVASVPKFVRQSAGTGLSHIPIEIAGTVLNPIAQLSKTSGNGQDLARYLPRAGQLLRSSSDITSFHEAMIAREKSAIRRDVWAGPGPLQRNEWSPSLEAESGDLEKLTYFDQLGELCDDMLVKVDRASMAASLETRSPFLDHRVVEWSWTLPPSFKRREGKGKWILRELLGTLVPPSLFERPKQGFSIPIGDWLRGPLRGWAEDLLSPDTIREQGILDAKTVQNRWLATNRSNNYQAPEMWAILMFQAWMAEN